MKQPYSPDDQRPTEAVPLAEARHSMVGPYRLLERIGEGGMGVVWRAEQDSPRRQVAVKVIKAGMDTKEVVARFEAERQALALMNHPNVAKVFDAGETPSGRPFFAMELVRGEPINAYCDKNRLTTKQRLELFIEVCEGVQHAHQKGIIHRDLKPQNILVTIEDGRPAAPKIIDFGVAKATGRELTQRTLYTELGQLIGTPEYMSPEQAEMTGSDIDTRTDVYSLGVLLYELLSGSLPFDSKTLREGGLVGIQRRIREEEPQRPSTRVSSLGKDSTAVAEHRRTETPALVRGLRGDLDWITMKALEKDRARRYETVNALALDVQRYLSHEPVTARPPSASYRVRKFVRRHRGAVVAAALLISMLVVAVIGTSVGLVRARSAELVSQQEAERANREAEAAQKIADFLVGLFEVSDPGEARGREITAREILDRGAERLDAELREQPQMQARLYDVVGSIYQRLGLYARAAPLYERSIGLSEQEFGVDSAEYARSAANKASLLVDTGQYEEAESFVRKRLVENRRLFGDGSLEVAQSLDALATILQHAGRLDEARSLFEEALATRLGALGEEHSLVSTSLNNLALLYQDQGEYALAEPLLRRALEIDRRLLGSPHPELAIALGNLGMLLRRRHHDGDDSALQRAEPLVREAYEMQREVLGENHALFGNAANDWALVLEDLGDSEKAEGLFRQALGVHRRALGEHAMVAVDLNNLASAIASQGRYQEAETMYLDSLSINQRLLGENHPDTSYQFQGLGSLYERWQKPEKAIEAYERALDLRRAALGETHPVTISSVIRLGTVLIENGSPGRGEALLRETRALVAAGSGDPSTLEALDEALKRL